MDRDEMDSWQHFQLICKPEQSGKTFVMIQQIIADVSEPIQGKKMVNFILCDNNLLLTAQTSQRVGHDLNTYYNGIPYIELSSHERTVYHDNTAVFKVIVADGVRNVICCTNGKRMDDIYQIIDDINKGEDTTNKYHFTVWLDEADKFIKFIDNTLRPITEKHPNVHIKLITATSEPLFAAYGEVNVLPLENTTSSAYHGWEDNHIRIIGYKGSIVAYAEHVLKNVAPGLVVPGSKWFIPGVAAKRSHVAITNMCVEQKMACMRINGDGITITLPTMEVFTYKKTKELNTMLIELYAEHQLHRFPLAITGNLCIGRGITINSEQFMLDYAILSHYSNKNEASQIAGRLKGNMKEFSNYRPPMVFTTEDFNEVAIEWEQKSRNLAKLAFQKQQNGESTVITKSEFKTMCEPYDYKVHSVRFDSFEKAKGFLVTKERAMKGKVGTTKKSVIHDREGYMVTSKLLKPGETVDDLTKENRITVDMAKLIPASRCISSTDKGSRYLIMPVYETMSSPPESVTYEVRYIHFE
jgi:hypothetical protein